jgi:hypothetical protein
MKGRLVKIVRNCSWPVSKVLLINRALQMKICLIANQNVVQQVWIFRQYFLKMKDNILNAPLCPYHSKNAQFAICMGEDSGCTEHSCQTCLTVERAYVQIASDCGRQMPHSDNVLGCRNWGRPTRLFFTRDRTVFTPLPYPSTDCIWRWGFMSIHFMAKSALSFHNGPRPNK